MKKNHLLKTKSIIASLSVLLSVLFVLINSSIQCSGQSGGAWSNPLPAGWSKSTEVTYASGDCSATNKLQYDDVNGSLYIRYNIPDTQRILSLTFQYYNDNYIGTIVFQNLVGATWTTLHTYEGRNSDPPCYPAITVNLHPNAIAIRWMQTRRDVANSVSLMPNISMVKDVALPVGLSEFTATRLGSVALLNWKTLSEQNNKGFEIERSNYDDKSWKAIGYVASKASNGYSYSELNYDFKDASMPLGISYYRLKQIDRDGKYSFSQVVRLANDQEGNTIKIYPNPTQNLIMIEGPKANETLRLYDIRGRMLYTTIIKEEKTSIDMGQLGLSPGIYQLYIINRQGEITVRKVTKI